MINKGRERNDGKRFEKSSKKPIKESMTTNVASIKILHKTKKRGKRGRINPTSHALDTFIGLVENKYLCANVILSYDFYINIYLLQSSKKYILKSTSY